MGHERPPGLAVSIPRLVFGEMVLFADLSCHFPAGAWTCLLGPSGVGKTTLLRLIAGLVSGGDVTADDGRPLAGRITLMAQQDLLLPWLDVLGNSLLGHRLRGERGQRYREREAQARKLLARLGLGRRLTALPAQLSGGMRQRVALARTFMEERPVVLMDEPFSALDAISRHRLQEMAAELLDRHTVLLVTHSPLEALRLGHRILVMGGQPVTLREIAAPPGPPPRQLGDPALLALEAELLEELAASDAQMEEAWASAAP